MSHSVFSKRFRLDELCTLVKGTSPALKTEPGPYPLVVTAAYRRTSATPQLTGPAICIPLISSTGHGDAALHRIHYQEGAFALSNLLVALILRSHAQVVPKYLFHLLNTRRDELFVSRMQGTANVSLKERDIASVEIPLPPLDEQRRIVGRIEAVARRVEEARRLRKEISDTLSAFHATRATALIEAFGCSEYRPVESLAEVRGGIQKGPHRQAGSNPVRYLTVAHVQRDRILLDDPRFFEVNPDELQRWKLHSGDVLVIEGNGSADQIGRAALFRGEIEDCVHQNHVIRIRPDRSLLEPEFLNAYLNSPAGQEAVREQSRSTSGLRTLSVGRIKQIRIPDLSLADQRRLIIEWQRLATDVVVLRLNGLDLGSNLLSLNSSMLARSFRGDG